MQTNKFTLQQYSCLAGVLLLIHTNAEAEAIYSDLEPDIEIQFDGETFNINIDSYGGNDFRFLKTSMESYYFSSASTPAHYRSRRGLWVGAIGTSQNELVGVYATNGGDPTTYFAYKLNSGYLIYDALSFQNANSQVMAVARIRIEIDEDWYVFTGGWAFDPQNKYIGVRFIGQDECLHYGWIRCSMLDTANKLIIHDYAYESKCNTGIVAGDTIGDTTVGIGDINNLDAVVYSFGKSVFVKLNGALNNAELHVYNLEGKEIYRNELQDQFSEIKVNASKGIYLVEIITDEGRFTKKVYLD